MVNQVDCGYATSCLGIMKILEFISTLVAFACLLDSTGGVRAFREDFFLGANVCAFVFVIVWFLFYLFVLCHHVNFPNRVLVFVIIHVVWFVILLVSGALLAANAARLSSYYCRRNSACTVYEVAAAFGLISALLFLIDAILLWKNTNVVTGTSGQRTVTTSRTVVKTTRRV